MWIIPFLGYWNICLKTFIYKIGYGLLIMVILKKKMNRHIYKKKTALCFMNVKYCLCTVLQNSSTIQINELK